MFTYMGFRYAEVTLPAGVRLANITADFVHTNVSKTGNIAFANSLLERIERATRYSAMSNLQSVPTDCPQRERHGWLGDAHLTAEGNIFTYDMAASYAKYVRDIRDTQARTAVVCTGQNLPVSAISPAYPGMLDDCKGGGPAWGAGYTLLVDYLVRYYDDIATLRESYLGMKAYLSSLRDLAAHTGGLLTESVYGDWCNVDLGMPQDLVGSCSIDSANLSQCGCNVPPNRRHRPLVSAFFYLQQLEVFSEFARRLNETTDAQHFSSLASDVRAAFTAKFVTVDSNGTVVVGQGYQTDMAMALFLDLIPAGLVKRVQTDLIRDVLVTHKGHLSTGMVGTKFLLPALSAAGQEGLEAA